MKLKMTIDECIAFADEWSRGMTYHEDSRGWRVVCMLLAEEVRRLQRGEFICHKCGLRKDSEHSATRTAGVAVRPNAAVKGGGEKE